MPPALDAVPRHAQVACAHPGPALPPPPPPTRPVRAVQSMEPWAGETIEPMLLAPHKAWQPTDFLPDSSSPDFLDAVQAFRDECAELPAEYLVVLVGDMVTEEALPSYMSMLNRMDGTADETGALPSQ
jgi:acyl-[acyl-carrier-protein] desaturase